MQNRTMVNAARLAISTIALLLVASSCTSLGLTDDAGSDPTTSVEVTGSTSPSSLPVVVDEDEETIEDLEVEWQAQRARVVNVLASETYGIGEDNILRGPGLFELDLDDCPEDWNDQAGLDDTTIRIGIIVAQTGKLSSFGQVAQGMTAYFDWVNDNGGIDGRLIEVVLRDDAYDAGVAQAAIDDLLDVGDPFYVTNVGSPGALAIYDQLNEECIPQPFIVSAHPAWGDPEEHPFTSGFQLSYSTEAIMWGVWIKNNLASQVPVTVAALVTDNDFGQVYEDAFAAWADANPDVVSKVTFVRHDPQALEVLEEMEEVAEIESQVFLSMTTGQPCLSAVREADRLGLTESTLALFTPSVCKQPSSYMVPLGMAGDGFLVVGGGVKSAADPSFADETYVKFVRSQLEESGLNADRSLIGLGFSQYGWAHVELLKVAAAMPGGLTRSNIALALRNIDLQHPMLFEGVRFSTSGTRDGFPIEGAEFSRYDAEARAWMQVGSTVDLNGSSPNCSWVQLACEN